MLPFTTAAAPTFAAQADRSAYPREAKLILNENSRAHGDMCEAEQCQPGVCIGSNCSSRASRYEIGRSPNITDYQYVGPGRGEFSLRDLDEEMATKQPWSIRLMLGRCAVLCSVVLLALLLWLLYLMLTRTSSATMYDCTAGYENWLQQWTAAKRSWCCEHRSRGCFVPHGSLQLPSGMPPDSADCSDTARSTEWPALYRNWCCAKRQLGCQAIAVTSASSTTKTTTLTSSTRKATTSTSATKDGYDCVKGFAHWEKLWKPSKSSWCCKHLKRGCSATPAQWPPTLDPSNYSCTMELLAVPDAWSASERIWCCEHRGRGCPTAPPTTTTSSTTRTISTVTVTATSITSSATSTTTPAATVPYHCKNPLSAVRDWSDSKKVWCCVHQARGCPTPMPSTTSPVPTTTPPPAPYNCSGAPSDWTVRWSMEKKRWCCEYGVCPSKA